MKRHPLLLLLAAPLFAGCTTDAGMFATDLGGPQLAVGWVEVCHLNDVGGYKLITIADPALPTHISHGDAAPGDLVPADHSKYFGPDCGLLVRPGVRSNQDAYGAGFSFFVLDTPAWLKFNAYEGTSTNQGSFEWRLGVAPSWTYAFDGVVTSAQKDVNGVWAIDIDVTANANLAGGIDGTCNIRFLVKDMGSTGDIVVGWAWLSPTTAVCIGSWGSAGDLTQPPPPHLLTSGEIVEY